MTRSKASSSKKQHGMDFKKIRRKIGRKLPPPKNSTSTEIKSKSIILPEQSVASDKTGLAVNRRGLTLKELLQQTSHHNPKARRDALKGIKDLFIKYPAELKLHKYAVVEKLRERIGDDDKEVRRSLYELFKSVILPGCREDNQELVISLLMAYIFNAMTHLAIDIRFMAFEFLDLVLEFYPPSLSSYAQKIFQSYEDILRKNQYYLQDKAKLKNIVAGLVHCLSLLPWNKEETDLCEKLNDARHRILHFYEDDKPAGSTGFFHIIKKLKDLVPLLLNSFQEFIPMIRTMPILDKKSIDCMLSILDSIDLMVRSFVFETDEELGSQSSNCGTDVSIWNDSVSSILLKKLLPLFPLNSVHQLKDKDDDRFLILNMVITKVFFQLNEWICLPPDLLEKFVVFVEHILLGKICSAGQFGRVDCEKHLVQLLHFIPKLVCHGASYWTSRLLQAFTHMFRESKPGSSLKLACLSAIENMLTPIQDKLYLNASNPENLDLQDALIAWIRELPLLLIQLGDKHPTCSHVVLHLQLRIGQCALLNSSLVCIDEDIQCSLQEFYHKCEGGNACYGPFIRLPRESQELALCCLYYFSHLDTSLLESIASCCLCPDLDPQVSFRIIEVLHSAYRNGRIKIADHLSFFITLLSRFKVFQEIMPSDSERDSNCKTFKAITAVVCSYLVQMGDSSFVLQMIEKVILDQIVLKPPLDNICSLLRMLVTLDSKPTRLSEQSVVILSSYIAEYLMDVVQCISEVDEESTLLSHLHALHYYLLPCFFLFDQCHKLMNLALERMGSAITESRLLLVPDNCFQNGRDFLSRVDAVASVLLLMHKDAKMHRIMSLFKADINDISQKVLSLQSSEEVCMQIELRHKIQCNVDRLKVLSNTLS